MAKAACAIVLEPDAADGLGRLSPPESGDLLVVVGPEGGITEEETAAGTIKDDIAITPLAVPMLAGPGAISTAILLHSQADGIPQRVGLYLCLPAIR